jgi:hypothetical protein
LPTAVNSSPAGQAWPPSSGEWRRRGFHAQKSTLWQLVRNVLEHGDMKNSNSAVHYIAAPQQQVSKKTALIVVVGMVVLAGVLFAVAH